MIFSFQSEKKSLNIFQSDLNSTKLLLKIKQKELEENTIIIR